MFLLLFCGVYIQNTTPQEVCRGRNTTYTGPRHLPSTKRKADRALLPLPPPSPSSPSPPPPLRSPPLPSPPLRSPPLPSPPLPSSPPLRAPNGRNTSQKRKEPAEPWPLPSTKRKEHLPIPGPGTAALPVAFYEEERAPAHPEPRHHSPGCCLLRRGKSTCPSRARALRRALAFAFYKEERILAPAFEERGQARPGPRPPPAPAFAFDKEERRLARSRPARPQQHPNVVAVQELFLPSPSIPKSEHQEHQLAGSSERHEG